MIVVPTLVDDPALLLVGMVLPLLGVALVLVALCWVVRLAVRHGTADVRRGHFPPDA